MGGGDFRYHARSSRTCFHKYLPMSAHGIRFYVTDYGPRRQTPARQIGTGSAFPDFDRLNEAEDRYEQQPSDQPILGRAIHGADRRIRRALHGLGDLRQAPLLP